MTAAVDILARGEAIVRLTDDPGLSSRLAERETAVAALWEEAQKRQPALFDAPLPHYLGLTASSAETELRATAIQFRQLHVARLHPEWELGLMPIGVSGITICQDKKIVLAKRSLLVSQYKGYWELAPSGHLCSAAKPPAILDHETALLEELTQELGLAKSLVQECTTMGVLRDNTAPGVDVCCLIRVAATAQDIEQAMRIAHSPREYTALSFLALAEFRAIVEAADSLVPTSRELLRLVASAL